MAEVSRASIRASPSFQHPALLARAWDLPVARLYAPLASQTFTSICGPTSVSNVLRSLGVRAGRNPFPRFGLRAMSLDELTREATAVLPAGWSGHAVRARTLDEFRAHLRRANEPTRRYVANFSRAPLFGRGGGHHSPLGGFLETEDLAFVLDVNAGFGPWLVSAARLFEAVSTDDGWSGPTRGLACFEALSPSSSPGPRT